MKRRGSDDNFRIVAVAYNGETVVENFEQANAFWIYYIDKGKVKRHELLSQYAGSTTKKLTEFKNSVIDTIICRNFGPRAMHELKDDGFYLYLYQGGCDKAIKAFLAGELKEL